VSTAVRVDLKPEATSSAILISARRGCSEPSSHHARIVSSATPVALTMPPTMEGHPSRLRDGPELGYQGSKPFGRLDAELKHQHLTVPGELPKRFGRVALCDVHPD